MVPWSGLARVGLVGCSLLNFIADLCSLGSALALPLVLVLAWLGFVLVLCCGGVFYFDNVWALLYDVLSRFWCGGVYYLRGIWAILLCSSMGAWVIILSL